MNPFQESARLRKAIKLIEVMRVNGWTDDQFVGRMEDDHWQVVANLADVKLPSAATRDLVREQLRESRRIALAAVS